MPRLFDATRHKGPRFSDVSGSAVGAGLLAVLVSFAGPLLIYLSAAEAVAVSNETFTSWVFAISMAAGLSSIGLSFWFRVPIAMAWSAPGTVLLISIGTDLSPSEIVGAYLVVAVCLILIGFSGVFELFVQVLTPAITNGMMAGILFGFGLRAASGLASDPLAICLLLATFSILTAFVPKYAMLVLLAVALGVSSVANETALSSIGLSLGTPEWTSPSFSIAAMLSLAVPLLITTLSGQYLPGMAIIKSNGYKISANPILIFGGIASAVAALFGGITTALASITAAFCAGPDSHEDSDRRYVAGIACGAFFCLCGAFSGSIVDAIIVLPASVIALLAGLALLRPILKFLEAMIDSEGSMAGLLTLIFTASNVSLFGIGSAFWGAFVGISFHVLHLLIKRILGRNL